MPTRHTYAAGTRLFRGRPEASVEPSVVRSDLPFETAANSQIGKHPSFAGTPANCDVAPSAAVRRACIFPQKLSFEATRARSRSAKSRPADRGEGRPGVECVGRLTPGGQCVGDPLQFVWCHPFMPGQVRRAGRAVVSDGSLRLRAPPPRCRRVARLRFREPSVPAQCPLTGSSTPLATPYRAMPHLGR